MRRLCSAAIQHTAVCRSAPLSALGSCGSLALRACSGSVNTNTSDTANSTAAGHDHRLQQQANLPVASSSLSVSSSSDNANLLVGEWEMALEEKFGTGTHRLRRALFREFCDEMRGEIHTKPPAPLGCWKVRHTPGTDVLSFSKDRSSSIDGVDVSVVARLYFKDPPGKADFAPIVDNHFVNIFVERNGVVIEYEAAFIERNFEIKNIKVYQRNLLEELGIGKGNTLDATAARIMERKEFIYDGPSIHHLEEDLYGELHDIVVTAEIDKDFQEFAIRWIAYLEHVEYLRWSLSVQDSVLAADAITVDELLTEVELDIVKTPMDNWRREEADPSTTKRK